MSSRVDQDLEKFVREYNFTIPDRGNLDDPSIEWRNGKPDYCQIDLVYFQGKSKNHKLGSLEMIVENLVKKWEMELTHIPNFKNWSTVEPDEFCAQVNSGPVTNAKDIAIKGSYNWILQNASKNLYDAQTHTFESSHKLFRGTFTDGFAWEVLEVFSGPPKVAFTWRHWGSFKGEFKGRKGKGENIELYGFTVATLSDNGKIVNIETYVKINSFLQALQGELPPSEIEKGKGLLGSCCPIHQSK
jgi:hypothetical protein